MALGFQISLLTAEDVMLKMHLLAVGSRSHTVLPEDVVSKMCLLAVGSRDHTRITAKDCVLKILVLAVQG